MDYENMSYVKLWNKIKELKSEGIDVSDMKYGLPKEDFVEFLTALETPDYSEEEEEVETKYFDKELEEEDEVPEISTIDDLPEDDEEYSYTCDSCGKPLDEDGGCEDCEAVEEEVSEVNEDGGEYSVDEEDIEEEEEEPKLLIPEVSVSYDYKEPEPVVIPKPTSTKKVYRLFNDADIKSYIGKDVEFRMDWFKGATSCLINGTFVIKMFEKDVLYRGKLTVQIYKWIKSKRVKITRW